MKKWSPVLENMGVTGEDRLDWMSEYAEYHSINENAYLNAGIAGMGAVSAPQPSSLAGALQGTNWTGNSGTPGSGDLGQNLLPVAMKIAAQTIGLDLVAVKPTPGPKIDLLYIDFQYDDVDTAEARPQVFKVNCAELTTVTYGLNYVMSALTPTTTQTVGGLQGGRIWVNISTGATIKNQAEPDTKTNIVEFLGFSRIDGYPMFRAYNQANARSNATVYGGVGVAPYMWDATKNTFGPTSSIIAQIVKLPISATAGGVATGVTVSNVSVELISALEDHIPGFVSNWTAASSSAQSGLYPMSRANDDLSYAGVIGPKVSSKSVAVGTIEVSSALRRTEIEDIKANTGMDIVQKMESILVNELSQTISKQIVAKVFELGAANRLSAPAFGGTSTISGQTVFDLDTAYASSGGPGGETTHAVQRKLITKLVHASNYIATEGRVGPAQYAVTNGGLAAAFMDIAGYTINPVKSKINGSGQLYPVGQIGDITIYVDPYMRYNDNRIALGRKNNPDQPGLIFVPYLMAQSISVISEATFAPRMLLRSRYAVAEVGWFPQKQYMEIKVLDNNSYLN
jgi:hypothetical protein